MLARRVIAISPDQSFAKRLVLGLKAAGGTVESYPSLDAMAKGEIQAALVCVHLDGELDDALPQIAERLRKDAWLIAVIPKSNLTDTVAIMQTTDRLAGVVIADDMPTEALASIATRVLYGDIFGVEKLVPWGVKVYSMLVGDYQEKSVCIAQISEYAALMGVRRKYREAIEQCVDEMLMNALYDAPVDADGKQLFADVPTKTRISLRMEQKAVVQYACDGGKFTVSVRDGFGTLDRHTVLKYLHKCLHSDQQIDRKTGGAGLGLYIIANATTVFMFNVLPGVATECLCTFDLKAPKVQLKRFGFFQEKIDASGRLVAGASKLLPSGAAYPVERRETVSAAPRGVMYALSGAIVLLLALIALVAYPKFIKTPKGEIRITTTPPGSTITVDGRSRGVTAESGGLLVGGLEIGRAYRVSASKEGWNSAETVVEPVKGGPVQASLTLAPKAVTVFLDSDPQGAEVFHNGVSLGKTPINATTLPPSTQVELVFRKTGYADGKRSFRVPAPGGEASISTTLRMAPDFGSVIITSEPPGAQVFQNGELLAGVKTPVAEHLVSAGKQYKFTVKAPGHMPGHAKVQVVPGQRGRKVHIKLRAGGGLSVKANVRGRVYIRGGGACNGKRLPLADCPLANGTYKVRIESNRPFTRHEFQVVISSNEVEKEVKFGFVEAAEGWTILRRRRRLRKTAYEEGTQRIVLENSEKKRKTTTVRIRPGRPVTVP